MLWIVVCCVYVFVVSGRKALVYAGPHPVEGDFSVHVATEKHYGIRIHHHRWRRAGRVPAGQECDYRWACCTGWQDGYRYLQTTTHRYTYKPVRFLDDISTTLYQFKLECVELWTPALVKWPFRDLEVKINYFIVYKEHTEIHLWAQPGDQPT